MKRFLDKDGNWYFLSEKGEREYIHYSQECVVGDVRFVGGEDRAEMDSRGEPPLRQDVSAQLESVQKSGKALRDTYAANPENMKVWGG